MASQLNILCYLDFTAPCLPQDGLPTGHEDHREPEDRHEAKIALSWLDDEVAR